MSYQALLFCPDDKTARVVTQVLTELEFSVELCNEPFAMVKKLMARQYDAIVVDTDNEQNATLLFKSARNSTSNQASLAVAVVEGQAGVAKAFRIGANLVLTKPVNVEQSKGTLRVARGLLRKAEAGKTPSPKTSSPAGGLNSFSATIPAVMPPAITASNSAVKFAATMSANPPTLAADASTASFDINQDPTPALDATEAAFLQSIPNAAPSKASAPESQSKESPWLQLSRPVPASGNLPSRTQDDPTATRSGTQRSAALTSQPPVRHPFNTGLSSAHAAAAAPAREKEKGSPSSISEPIREKVLDPYHDDDPGKEAAGKSGVHLKAGAEEASSHPAIPVAEKKEGRRTSISLIAALAVTALAAAGYYGWDKLQIANAPPPAVQSAPAVPKLDSSTEVPAEMAPGEPVTATTQSQPSQPVPQLNQDVADTPRSSKSSSVGKSSGDEIVVVENSPAAGSLEAKPISVKRNPAPEGKPAPAPVQQTLAPPPIQAVSGATDQTIAHLITPASVPVLKQTPQLLKISQGITQGLLVKKVNPIYPPEARQLHREGTVEIVASISKTGSISSAKVVKGDAMLGSAALTAVKQWKYKPYTLDGQAVDVQTQISVTFKLP